MPTPAGFVGAIHESPEKSDFTNPRGMRVSHPTIKINEKEDAAFGLHPLAFICLLLF